MHKDKNGNSLFEHQVVVDPHGNVGFIEEFIDWDNGKAAKVRNSCSYVYWYVSDLTELNNVENYNKMSK